MIKQKIVIEVKRDERIYQLQLPDGSPLGEIYDVLFQMRSFVIDKINEVHKAEAPKEPIEAKVE